MNSKNLIFLAALAAFGAAIPPCFAQVDLNEPGTFYSEEILDDGSIQITQNYNDPAEEEKHLIRLAGDGIYSTNGASIALDQLNLEQLKVISGMEILHDQELQLETIVNEYKAKSKGLNNVDKFLVRKKFEKRIKDVLLDSQLESIQRFSMRKGKVFSFILSDDISSHLDLSANQKLKIKNECRKSNDAISNAIRNLERVTKQERERANGLLGSLTQAQKEKLQKLIGSKRIETHFSSMNLAVLKSQVALKDEEKK